MLASYRRSLERENHVATSYFLSGLTFQKHADERAVMTSASRRTLPDSRPSLTHKFKIHSSTGDHSCYITVGFYDDEKTEPGEVFIRMGKMGSTLNGLLDTIGILISYGLQYGVPLGDLVGKLRGMTFAPDGPTSNPDIETCSSIVDYLFRWLDREFGPFDRPPSTSPLVEENEQ